MDFRSYIYKETSNDNKTCQMCGRPKKEVLALHDKFFTHPTFGSICGKCSATWL